MFYNIFLFLIFFWFFDLFLFISNVYFYLLFIPEDNEREEKMNVFIIYKDYKDIKISDIKENFPIPRTILFQI